MNQKTPNEELGRLDKTAFKASDKKPIAVVLDNVRSLHNVGSVFRTCDAFLIHEILLCGVTGQPPHSEMEKTALGATETVDWKYFSKTSDAVEYLKENGWKIYAVEQTKNSVLLQDFVITKEKVAFVFGNEVYGVDQEVIDQCDGVIEIPQAGTKHSLNIAVSAGIVLWEVFKKIKKKTFLFK